MTEQHDKTNANDPWIPIGGGAINEKRRVHGIHTGTLSHHGSHYDPSSVRSHLWHSLEGLDRYPNYLSRWSDEDMTRLEDSLEGKLELVREQRRVVKERRDGIQRLVEALIRNNGGDRWKRLLEAPTTWERVREKILDPHAGRAVFRSRMFANASIPSPSLQKVMSGEVAVELDAAQLEVLMDEELFDVYSFQLLSADFCRNVREYVVALSELGQTEPFSHLNVGRRPVNLDDVGLGWLNDLLFQIFVRPISRHLFRTTETVEDLDWRHGFVTGYSSSPPVGKPRERLVAHTDDSEVTLNVGLGADFEGGLVEFRGLRGSDDEGELIGTVRPQMGLAVLHAGRHLHDVTQVVSGDRFALILWTRSWKGARAAVCPCCWLNRRKDNACVCGARWN